MTSHFKEISRSFRQFASFTLGLYTLLASHHCNKTISKFLHNVSLLNLHCLTYSLPTQGKLIVQYLSVVEQEAQIWLTNRAMLVCKVVEVWQDFLSEYVDKKFTYICYRRLIRH